MYCLSAVLLGISIMNIPVEMFGSSPMLVRPLLSSGLFMGIILAIILENTINWSKLDVVDKEFEKNL